MAEEINNSDARSSDNSKKDDSHAYERPYVIIDEDIRKFLTYFRYVINDGLIYKIQNLYENTWPKLTNQYFDKRPWPEDEDVMKALCIDNFDVFMVLYKELTFRHLHSKVQSALTLEQRFGAFNNYCDLFNYVLGETPVILELPDLWLWEMIDEFIYQFQSFAQYRSKPLSKEEGDLIVAHFNTWSILCVLNVFYSFVDRSNIREQLKVYSEGGDPDCVAGEFGRLTLYKMLGYFSLVGLLRVHSIVGDYYQAIKVLENIEIYKKHSHIPGCQISMAYYVGFAYMMMRRYSDAIRTLSSILLDVQRTKHLFQARTSQNEQINKLTEQMYLLLAMCLVLHPQCIDESIQYVLKEKNYHEKMFKMQCGDLMEFESCFLAACPTFVSPSTPSQEMLTVDSSRDATKLQTRIFMDEVQQQKMLPIIRSYLKLYTTLPIHKLASLMSNVDSKDDTDSRITDLRTDLLCFKHKMKNIVWTRGISGLDGHFHSGSELDFYIDREMIHIADTKIANRYGDFFIRKIMKFEELNRKLHSIKI